MEAAFVSGIAVPIKAPLRQATCIKGTTSSRRARTVFHQRVRMCTDGNTKATSTSNDAVDKTSEKEDTRSDKQKEIDRLRAAEKFIQVDLGIMECPGCGYTYEPAKGEFLSSIPSGTAFEDLPDNFACPACRTPKSRFFPVKKTIAGFADNQGYGFGTNSLTAGQKNTLIFGGLLLGFLLLLSGYALD